MNMKKIFYISAVITFVLTTTIACMDEWDTPNTNDYAKTQITSPVDVGPATMTLSEFKDKYKTSFQSTNKYKLMKNDCVIEGIVLANDESGNLYQSVYLGEPKVVYSDGGRDSIIVPNPEKVLLLALKNTCLHPFFQLGQKVRVNVKDLYYGTYSYVPKIGQPYKTSAGNWRLGPVLMELAETHVYLDGDPYLLKDAAGREVRPTVQDYAIALDDDDPIWTDASQKNYQNTPMLVTCEGYFILNDTTKHLGDYDEHDDGYGVNRYFKVGNSYIQVRTSTQNEVSYINLPKKTQRCRLTGILTYYTDWQLQLCNKSCFELIDEPNE